MFRPLRSAAGAAGFTLIEVIIVISLMALVYAIALPNFSLQKESEIADRLGRFSEDVRAAFDITVLTGKPHRLVLNLRNGEYFLERSNRATVKLGEKGEEGGEISPRQEQERQAAFDEQFKDFEQMLGEPFRSPDDDTPIARRSPILQAKDQLRGPTWQPAEGMGWTGKRSFGELLIIKDFQSEHLPHPLTLEDRGENAVALVYFFPRGYVERTMFHVYLRKGDNEIDNEQPPYTIRIDPYLGTADVISGYEEINVVAGKEKSAG